MASTSEVVDELMKSCLPSITSAAVFHSHPPTLTTASSPLLHNLPPALTSDSPLPPTLTLDSPMHNLAPPSLAARVDSPVHQPTPPVLDPIQSVVDAVASDNIGEDPHSDLQSEAHSSDDNCDDQDLDSNASGEHRFHPSLTGRGVTIATLMTENVIQPGDGVMSLEYLGQKFVADLLNDGRICDSNGQMFSSPSAWAIFCKKLVNPGRRSGCGWASVKYKGKKLDLIKSSFVRKQNPTQSPIGLSQSMKPPEMDQLSSMSGESPSVQSQSPAGGNTPVQHHIYDTQRNRTLSTSTISEDEQAPLNLSVGSASPFVRQESPEKSPATASLASLSQFAAAVSSSNGTGGGGGVRSGSGVEGCGTSSGGCNSDNPSVKHATLPPRDAEQRSNSTMVHCTPFSTLGRIQPFLISASCNSLLLMDLHAHLTHNEVCGYLGGRWDNATQELQIAQSFPCLCNTKQQSNASIIEDEIRRSMVERGLSLVGWYHSHPHTQPDPTLNDIDSQLDYQLQLKGYGNSYHPCIALIISPYESHIEKKESTIQAYWVMPPPEHKPNEYGMPMRMSFDVHKDAVLTKDSLLDMKRVADMYLKSKEDVKLQDTWHGEATYLDKLKVTLSRHFPNDQTDGRFMDFILTLLAVDTPTTAAS